ncbi:MAG TPA: sugar ABC transporter permease [Chloroflexi bacterium]|nr:sugar ABC transporter permease [Chloroflexota bacterium]HBY08847.1 sugar ABC transporter permease [Chloroflexota bacterium]
MDNPTILAKQNKGKSKFSALERVKNKFVTRSLTPIMLYMLFFSLLPMVWAVVLGFFDYSPIRAGSSFLGLGGQNPFIGLDNYRAMFLDTQPARVFRSAVVNTFMFALLVLPINLAITLPLAVIIESIHERFKGFFRAIYFMPTISSSVAVAVMWGYIYHPQQGLLNSIIRAVGLTPPKAWLTDPSAVYFGIPLAMIAVIIAYIWQDFGYNLILFIAALQGIPREIQDAARVDGANAWNTFWRITLPLLKPTLLFVCVLTMLSSLQVFVIFDVMTNGGPRNQTTPLVMSIYQNAFRYQNMGWAAAISMVLFLIILFVTIVQFKVLRTDWEY